MAETLGSLCDKLIVVQLKIVNTHDEERRQRLMEQSVRLSQELDGFVAAAVRGDVPLAEVRFPAYKVVPPEARPPEVTGVPLKGIGDLVGQLAFINADLWHCVDQQHRITELTFDETHRVVQRTTRLNLDRNACIDAIDEQFAKLLGGDS